MGGTVLDSLSCRATEHRTGEVGGFEGKQILAQQGKAVRLIGWSNRTGGTTGSLHGSAGTRQKLTHLFHNWFKIGRKKGVIICHPRVLKEELWRKEVVSLPPLEMCK